MIFGSIFWASFFILLGISMLIQIFFGVHLPVGKIFIAIFLFYLGISILLGPSFFRSTVKVKNYQTSHDYVISFNKQTIDLTSLKPNKDETIDIVVVFGNGRLKLNPDIPTKIVFKGAFASIQLPDSHENNSLMGRSVYTTPSFDKNQDYILIEVVAVFSSMRISLQ
ncbi:MAG TPA: hypothetical protein VJ201_02960 [Candidatus Babeliales bacterium]|nr:hypothetical protein [Candidatus Babeliales bacterium]